MSWNKIIPWFIITFILSVVFSVVINLCFFSKINIDATLKYDDYNYEYSDGISNYYIDEKTEEYIFNEDEAITAITIPVKNGTFYITKNTINPDILTISAPANTTFTVLINKDVQEYTTKNNDSNIYTVPLNKGEVKIITETETLIINETVVLGE